MKSIREQLLEQIAAKGKTLVKVSANDSAEDSANTKFVPPPCWLNNDGSEPESAATPGIAIKSQQETVSAVPAAIHAVKQSKPATPIFRPRLDGQSLLVMPDWGNTGRALQHPEHLGLNSTPMVVRIGVDFGTAFTKVAIKAGVDLVPIDWSAVTKDDAELGRYVVPGFVVRSSEGEYVWQNLTNADVKGNLKLPLIQIDAFDECPIATVAFLALVIRYSRAYLYQNKEIGRKLIGRSLRWELNIGCPTEPNEDPKVVDLFRRIARTSWLLAGEERLFEQDVLAAWNLDGYETGLETEPGVVPEFVAQIAGYLKSSQAKAGLHALIDIGAATLDVATFNVVIQNNNDESSLCIPIFFSAVRPLGTHYLNHNRYSGLNLDLTWNDAAPVESSDIYAKKINIQKHLIDAIDNEFTNKVAHCINVVINGTRTNVHGDPNSSAWREGLPIFITGGGSNSSLYRDAIEAVNKQLIESLAKQAGSSKRFRLIELTATIETAQNIHDLSRLTVAIGLTEDSDNIARVVPHRDIEPITYEHRKRVDHTELYGGS